MTTAASGPSSEASGRGGSSNASSAGMAGIGAGRTGAASSYRSYAFADKSVPHEQTTAAYWNAFDSTQAADPSQSYGGLPTAQSISSFDTQPRAFDAVSLPSVGSLHTSQSMQHLPASSVDSATESIPLGSRQQAVSEAELLAFVEQKRAGAETLQKSSSRDPTTQAKDGNDRSHPLDTLDLCHKRMDRVPDALIDMIKDQVVRLALGYNHLTRLPDRFVDLSGLRYLNIRANNFAHFPECVTKMPNLEILDLSRNKVRKLPELPGRLLALRVLSMNANRLTELPSWVGRMKHLRILKLDNNPLEWPPLHISKMPNVAPPKPPSSSGSSSAAEREKVKRFEDRQMLVWIAKLRSWINDPANQVQPAAIATSEPQAVARARSPPASKLSDEGAVLAGPTNINRFDITPSQSDGLMSLQVQVPESVSDRKLMADASEVPPDDPLPTAATDRMNAGINAASNQEQASAPGLLPPLVPQPTLKEGSTSDLAQFTDSVPSYSRNDPQAQSAQPVQMPLTPRTQSTAGHRDDLALQIINEEADARQHARNNSHSVAQDIVATHQMEGRRSLKSKKSLPDLRKSHEDILQERRDMLADLSATQTAQQSLVQDPDGSSAEQGQPSALSSAASTPTANATTDTDPVAQSNPLHIVAVQSSNRKPLLQTRRALRPTLGNGTAPLSRQAYEGVTGSSAPNGTNNAQGNHSVSGQGGGLRKLSLPTVGATQAAAEAAAAALAARHGYSNSPARFDVGHGRIASDRGDNHWPSSSASPTVNAPRTAADQERNSYFRRLSTLPPSTISKAVPAPVLKFVDGTRGVLFALSQIHAAIGQFMTPVIDERISGQFHRLLDISNGSVANLINALDRFDSLSRRGTPDPSVIRGVLVTCKDSVITFRKLISVLQLQLRALQISSDVRYARTLLLMLYGSMAEVSNSWAEMAPLVEAVQPYLTQVELDSSSPVSFEPVTATTATEKATPPSTRAGTLLQKSISNTSNGSTSMLPSIAEASTPVRAGSRPYIPRGPSRRRHAGSFSAQDLAQGAAMTPSNSNQPPFNLEDLQAASGYNTPARSGRNRRQDSVGNSASSAATFAQSETSDRSAIADGVHSTAPSTPGVTGPSTAAQRTIYATPGAMSTPTSSRQKRTDSNASSAVGAGTPGPSAVMPRSQSTTPATPAAAAAAQRSLYIAMPSSANAAAAAAAGPAAAGSRLRAVVSDPKVTVDDHLLDMVDNITKLSARVWSLLFEHLRSAGVDGESTSSSPETSPVDDKQGLAPQADDSSAAAMNSSSSDGEKDADASRYEKATGKDEVLAAKLRELRDLAQITDDLTSQLRSTYLRAREEEHRRTSIDDDAATSSAVGAIDTPPGAEDGSETVPSASLGRAIADPSPENILPTTAARLFDESHQFVRAIVNTSTLIKTVSVSHEFPREVRRLLGQVAQACSNLTVYLLWLSPTSVA
ncbi:Leucine-rich repeat-containing protein SOG2 [Pseudozyma hubeiensis]|nr:Leucine-rich repeat-containing protein SOG2 [Pseudozyma hubeiensis]